ncbi:hypothetical protein [Oleiharenicola lentus]|uniref:hypothetical protein n=1 Tax=Oleiharenicola lentus TaxID=2508720 RepID=UPI003F670BA5
MNKIVIHVFCKSAGSTSPKPGTVLNVAKLNHVTEGEAAKPGNDAAFKDGKPAVSPSIDPIMLANLSDEALDLFKGGKTYKLTIEPVN